MYPSRSLSFDTSPRDTNLHTSPPRRLPDRHRRTISPGDPSHPSTQRMAITISNSFDAGNIRVISQDGDRADLEIVKDHMSDFYQWFYFRVAGGAGRELTLRLTNCAGSAYPHGWPG